MKIHKFKQVSYDEIAHESEPKYLDEGREFSLSEKTVDALDDYVECMPEHDVKLMISDCMTKSCTQGTNVHFNSAQLLKHMLRLKVA
jgi:hypothetical protein